MLIKVVQRQYKITSATVGLVASRLATALEELSTRWQKSFYLVGDRFSVADIADALLSPLALPQYDQEYLWLFERIEQIHQSGEPLLPELGSEEQGVGVPIKWGLGEVEGGVRCF